MSLITFEESGLAFKFEDDNCFIVENDPLVRSQDSRKSTQNNKACECVTFINNYHCFIEAKQSAPRGPECSVKDLRLHGLPVPPNWEIYDNYHKFLREIAKKFIDSFIILKAITEGRHGIERLSRLPLPTKKLDIDKIRFILIVNLGNRNTRNVDKEGLNSLQQAIRTELSPFLKTWNIKERNIKVVLPEDAESKLQIPLRRLT